MEITSTHIYSHILDTTKNSKAAGNSISTYYIDTLTAKINEFELN